MTREGVQLTEAEIDAMVNESVRTGEEVRAALENAPDEICGAWELRGLSDAYAEREPWQYLVDGLIPIPSLIAVYGGPGSLKSMAMADLCAAVAGGRTWLPPLDGKFGSPGKTFMTEQSPILWVDFDNGPRRTDERMGAVARVKGLPIDAPFHYVSMPRPWLDMSKPAMADSLEKLIKRIGAKLVVIDNLGLITGDTDENSAEMAHVMGHMRMICENALCCVAVIHHQRKSSGAAGAGIRKGETLRGNSAIEASLDLAILVERSPGEDTVTFMLTKVRGFSEHLAFGGMFTYAHIDGTHDLESAAFYSREVDLPAEIEIMNIEAMIIKMVEESPGLKKADLVDLVRSVMAAKPEETVPGVNKVRGLIKHLVDQGDLVMRDGDRNASLYYLP